MDDETRSHTMVSINGKADSSALATCKKLKDAYIRLAGCKDRNHINVSGVVKEAGLKNGLFYDYYKDINMLLLDIEKDAVNETVDNIVSVSANKTCLLSSLKGLAYFLNNDDPGHIRLFFAHEYSDFQKKYIDDVLSSSGFSEVLGKSEDPKIVKGYLSTFMSMYDQWRRGKITMSMDDFIKYATNLFENGLNGIQNG